MAGGRQPQAPAAGRSTTGSTRQMPRRVRAARYGDSDDSGHGFGRTYTPSPRREFSGKARTGPRKPATTCLKRNADPGLDGRISAWPEHNGGVRPSQVNASVLTTSVPRESRLRRGQCTGPSRMKTSTARSRSMWLSLGAGHAPCISVMTTHPLWKEDDFSGPPPSRNVDTATSRVIAASSSPPARGSGTLII